MSKKSTVSAASAAGTKSNAAPKPVESAYSAGELACNAEVLFKTRKECVAAALKAAGKDTATVSEAQKIVADFLHKEVK